MRDQTPHPAIRPGPARQAATIVAWSLIAGIAAGADLPPRKGKDTAELVLRGHAQIRSMRVTYKATTTARENGIRIEEGGHVLCTLCVKGPLRYASTAHVTPTSVPRDDPTLNEVFFDGHSLNVSYPIERVYETSQRFAVPEYTVKVRGDPILECLGWWPSDDATEPPLFRGEPFFLRKLIERRPPVVRDNTELIGERSCRLIELSGLDTLWLDVSSGDLIRRVHHFDATRAHSMVYDLGDYRPVADGPRLPHRLQRSLIAVESAAPGRVDTYVIVGYELNHVDDGSFAFQPPPGTLVIDRDTDRQSQVPGGLDLLDEVAGRSRRLLAKPTVTEGRLLGGSLWFLIGTVLALGGDWMIHRSRPGQSSDGWPAPIATINPDSRP